MNVSRSALRCAGVDLVGAVVETAWVGLHLATYPWGFRRLTQRTADAERCTLTGLTPARRALLLNDVAAAATPIVFLHGFADNRSIFTLLQRALRRRGFGRMTAVNYNVLTCDVPAAARRLSERIEQLCAETGYDRVHVIAHSLGGVAARWYVQRLGGDARVHTVVTLGSPHGGTWTAQLLPLAASRQVRPGSALLTELAEPAPGCRSRFLAISSDLDELILPRRAGRIDHPDLSVRNVVLRGVGHMTLPIDRRVIREISATLAQLDPAGRTVLGAATPLADPSRLPTARRAAEDADYNLVTGA